MDKSIFLEKGIAAIKEATDKDNQELYQEAFGLYLHGCQYLQTAIKYEPSERLKKLIRDKVKAYITRCEELQVFLKGEKSEQSSSKSRSLGAKSSAPNGGENEKKDTKEETEMMSAISKAIVATKPNVKWSDVAGLKSAKSALMEAVIYPLKYPQFFTGKRKPWKGILMYGPPGTGKTFLAKAVATEANNSTFLSISTADLMSKYVGEGEKMVRALFETARRHQPAIVFIDEIESLAQDRESAGQSGGGDAAKRMLTEFLVQMDGVGSDNENLLVLGATNLPWSLDMAIKRRFQKRILIPLPDLDARRALFKLNIGDTPSNVTDDDIQRFAEKTEGFSGSDIKTIVNSALYEPLGTMQEATHFLKVVNPDNPNDLDDWRYVPCTPGHPRGEELSLSDLPPERMRLLDVSCRDFEKVIQAARPTVSQKDVARHQEWTKEFGQEGG